MFFNKKNFYQLSPLLFIFPLSKASPKDAIEFIAALQICVEDKLATGISVILVSLSACKVKRCRGVM